MISAKRLVWSPRD